MVDTEKKQESLNCVRIAGVIVNKYETEHMVKLTVAVTEPGIRGKVYTNYPTVYFFKNGKEQTTPVDNFRLHDTISLEGHLSSSRSRTLDGTQRTQQIVGDTASPIEYYRPNEIDGYKGRRVEIHRNIIKVTGVIEQITQKEHGITSLRLRVNGSRVRNLIEITTFGNIAKDAEVGDEITVYGRVATAKKERNGTQLYYQDFVGIKITQEQSEDVEENMFADA